MKRLLILTSCLCLTACAVNTNYGRWSYSGQPRGIFSLFSADQSNSRRTVKEIDPAEATQRAADKARREAERLKAQVNSAQVSLAGNRAWQNGECVKPHMRDLPPRPQLSLSDDEINRQAIGHCLDLSARRMSSRQLYEALYSANMDDYWTTYQQWQKAPKASCARVSRSLIDDWIATSVCSIGGKMGVWACTQDLIHACIKQSAANCRAPLNNWEQDVTAIRAEPEKLFQQCQSSLETIRAAQERIPQAEMEATLNAQEHQNLIQNR